MKKREIEKISLPLSRKDFKKLKSAFDHETITRADLPYDLLMAMDAMWAKDNETIYEEYKRRGIFGEYD